MVTHDYVVDLKWTSDRKGEMSSPELDLKFDVATPPQFPKGMPGIWSPEHLLTASVVGCYMTTFLAIAENFKLEFVDFKCNSSGKLEQVEGKYMMTEITLNPELVIKNEADREKAEKVLVKSEAACLISNSIKSKVILNANVKFLQPAQ